MLPICQRMDIYFNPLPRKEGDGNPVHLLSLLSNFNPLPRKEGDYFLLGLFLHFSQFQSTPS